MAHNPIDLYDPEKHEGNICYTKEERESMNNFINKGFVDTFRHLHPYD